MAIRNAKKMHTTPKLSKMPSGRWTSIFKKFIKRAVKLHYLNAIAMQDATTVAGLLLFFCFAVDPYRNWAIVDECDFHISSKHAPFDRLR